MSKTMRQLMIAAIALAVVASSVGSAMAISPQPVPPPRNFRALGPQPEPPDNFLRYRAINPQPEPPGANFYHRGFNPQPEPPGANFYHRGFNPQPEPPAFHGRPAPRFRHLGNRFHRPGPARVHFMRGRRR